MNILLKNYFIENNNIFSPKNTHNNSNTNNSNCD